MCVKESLYRAMGITLTVSLRMMFDVRCCPLKSRTFPRHGTKDEQNTLDDGMGTEAAMGQHTMITHRYTQSNPIANIVASRGMITTASTTALLTMLSRKRTSTYTCSTVQVEH